MSLYLLIQLFYKAPNFIISINCSFFPICHQLFIFFINTCMYLCLVTQSCSIPFNPIDCSPPGSSVHAILQARILESVAMPFSRGSSQPRDRLPHWQVGSLPVAPPGKFQWSIAAAAAKSLQSCPILCDPIDTSPHDSAIKKRWKWCHLQQEGWT